jgi:hypothetical protein
MEGITPFQSGRPLLSEITADKLNRILAEIKRNRPVVAAPLSARVTGDGTCISLLKQPAGGTTPTTRHPFQIASFPDPESEQEDPPYLVTVDPGTINNLLPTNLLDGQNLAEFELPRNTLRYVTLKATAASNVLTACTIALESSAPSPQEPLQFALPATYDVLLGVVYNSNVRQVVFNNLSVAGRQAYITDKTDPVPGTLPYNVFLQWG